MRPSHVCKALLTYCDRVQCKEMLRSIVDFVDWHHEETACQYKSIVLPNVDSLVVNPEHTAQAGKVGEGGPVPGEDELGQHVELPHHLPVPGEDGRGDTVRRGLARLHQPPSGPLLPHHCQLLVVADSPTSPAHIGCSGFTAPAGLNFQLLQLTALFLALLLPTHTGNLEEFSKQDHVSWAHKRAPFSV